MPPEDNHEYFLSRADEARKKADAEANPHIRNVYARMAASYAILGRRSSAGRVDAASEASFQALRESADILRETAPLVTPPD